MKHEQHHGPLEPQDVEELLPWYVTGRVSREEARGIEAALKTMPDLAGKLAQVQREREAVSRASETVEPAPPETLQRLLQQVETTRQWRVPQASRAIAKRAAGSRPQWAATRYGRRLLPPPASRSWPWASSSTMCRRRDQFNVAGNINGAGGATLVVTFQPGATAGDIGTLLTSLSAKIVDGPKPGGAYTVELPSNQASDVEAATASLLARKDLVAGVLPGQ